MKSKEPMTRLMMDAETGLVGSPKAVRAYQTARRKRRQALAERRHQANAERIARIQEAYKRGEWTTLAEAMVIA